MKTLILSLSSFAILTLSACQSNEAVEQSDLGKLAGAWEFVSSTVVLPDTTITNDQPGHSIYIMSDSHFAFVSTTTDDKELTHAGRGSYTVDGNTYTEHVDFHTASVLVGQDVTFEFQIEGDEMTKTSFLPIWEEIKPLAGDATEAKYVEVRRRVSGFTFTQR